ncbi:MAG: TlpA family protein disulfide reductase [Cyclobacteriaceae bacterium]|nr:TlpA family protein disulfide reductase [Cyclobacteriaceae bacterium]
MIRKYVAASLLVYLVILHPLATWGYELGDKVLDFTYNDLDGKPHTLYQHEGDVVVLNFFATWCPYCRQEAPSLEMDIWQPYKDFKVTVIALNLDENLDTVQDWVSDLDLTYEVLVMPHSLYPYKFPNAGAIPHNVVIDKGMVLRYSEIGYDKQAIKDEIIAILGFDPLVPEPGTWGGIKALFR